jgi:hypothetical protein
LDLDDRLDYQYDLYAYVHNSDYGRYNSVDVFFEEAEFVAFRMLGLHLVAEDLFFDACDSDL